MQLRKSKSNHCFLTWARSVEVDDPELLRSVLDGLCAREDSFGEFAFAVEINPSIEFRELCSAENLDSLPNVSQPEVGIATSEIPANHRAEVEFADFGQLARKVPQYNAVGIDEKCLRERRVFIEIGLEKSSWDTYWVHLDGIVEKRVSIRSISDQSDLVVGHVAPQRTSKRICLLEEAVAAKRHCYHADIR